MNTAKIRSSIKTIVLVTRVVAAGAQAVDEILASEERSRVGMNRTN